MQTCVQPLQRRVTKWLGALAMLFAGGCPSSCTPADDVDAGFSTSPSQDGGATDSGAADAGPPEAGAPDGGAPDSGAPDSGVPDSGVPDGGAPDSGALDSGPTDGGLVGDSGSFDPASWPTTADTVTFTNARGDVVYARSRAPAGAGPHPLVIVLHGSGGLFDEDSIESPDQPPELENQFERWYDTLHEAGYAVLMPASFFSRGFFDWNDDQPDDLDSDERLTFRIFDVHGALDWACEQPEIDCAKIGLLGFSNGASTAMLAVHAGLTDVDELSGLTASHWPKVSIAYYPGCGFQGFVTLQTDAEDRPGFYDPVAPVLVQHAELDPLLEHCPTRVTQAGAIAAEGALPNPVTLLVYEGAGHGFDSSPDTLADETARDDAEALTLTTLADFL